MTQENLFELQDSPSPRLQWMRKHQIQTFEWQESEAEEERFSVWSGTVRFGDWYELHGEHGFGTGATLDEALADWAQKFNVPLWNEEGAKK